MLAYSTTTWWVIGSAIGAAVVVLAASLLIVIISIGERIVGQAVAVIEALDATRENTNAMFDVGAVNHNIDRITRGLRIARGGA